MSEIKNSAKLRQFILLNLCLLTFTVIMLWIKPVNTLKGDYVLTNRFDFAERVFVYGDTVLKQEFDGVDGVDTVELLIVNANNILQGSYRVIITEDTGRVMGNFNEYKMDIPSDGLIGLRLKKPMTEGHTYCIELSAQELTEENALMVSLGYADLKAPGIGSLKAEGSEDVTDYCADKVLSLSLYRQYTNTLAYAAIVVVFVIANFCLTFKGKGIEFLSLPILIAAGVVMLLVLAPGSGPDDKFHYYSSYILSDAMMGRDVKAGVDNRYIFNFYVYEGYVGYNANSTFIKVLTEFGGKATETTTGYTTDVWTERWINPLAHPAPAIGITIGKLLDKNFVTVYTLGRIFNMLMYAGLAYAAIRMVPKNKELMLFIAMTPMAMQQCCSLSYDSVINGVTLLYTAYVLKLIHEKKDISIKGICSCVAMLAILAVVKVVYVILALLLIPVVDKHIKKIVPVMGIPTTALIILKWKDIAAVAMGSGADTYTILTIFEDPIAFIRLIVSTLEGNGWLYMKSMIGNLMTGGFTPVSEWFVIGYMVTIVLCILLEEKSIVDMRNVKTIIIATSILGSLVVLLTFALACTPIGSSVIMGVQGRYFFPFAIPVLFCLHGGLAGHKMNRIRLLTPIWFIEIGYIVCLMNQIYYDV